MNKKTLTYLLIAVVLTLWGNIFYRLFFYLKSSPAKGREDFALPELVEGARDSFSIHSNYPDPFLGSRPLLKPVVKNPREPAPQKKALPPAVSWPGISYTGMIRNQQSSKQLAMVVINGQSNLMQPGDSYQEIVLNKVYKDSIIVSLGKMKRTVNK